MTASTTTSMQRRRRPRHSSSAAAALVVLGLLACSCGGVAAARVGCKTNADCDADHFCHLPDTTCAPPGVCEPIPQICTMEYAPVCGCDGVTYPSRCGAFARGASYRFQGECENPPQPPQQQQPAVATAAAGTPGAVTQQKEEEGHGDGKRQRRGLGWKGLSEVFAASADFLSLRRRGDKQQQQQQEQGQEGRAPVPSEREPAAGGVGGEATRVPCGSRGLRPCEEGYFCEFVDGLCGETDTGGYCSKPPLGCPKIYRPVCGCDAVTYSNACVARSKGVSVRHDGDCASGDGPISAEPAAPGAATPPQEPGQAPEQQLQSCGGLMGKGCERGQACIYAMEAQCGAADQMGVCMTPPTFCTLNYQPVCGCDGNTYSNACHAHAKGVSVVSEGPCNAPRTPEEAAQQEMERKDAMLAHLRMHGAEEVGDAGDNGGL